MDSSKRKTVRIDTQTLWDLVKALDAHRATGVLYKDALLLGGAIASLSQFAHFHGVPEAEAFEVSTPDEEPKGRCCGWQPPGAHRIPCRRKEGHTGKHCWGSAMAMAMDEEAVLKPLSDCGDHMTLGYFLDCVESGCFTDDDGFGEYATETQVSGKRVHPSDVFASELDMNYTHVVWYNK